MVTEETAAGLLLLLLVLLLLLALLLVLLHAISVTQEAVKPQWVESEVVNQQAQSPVNLVRVVVASQQAQSPVNRVHVLVVTQETARTQVAVAPVAHFRTPLARHLFQQTVLPPQRRQEYIYPLLGPSEQKAHSNVRD